MRPVDGPGAMKEYRNSVRLKLGLIIFAVLIAVASLAYTDALVERLREREQIVVHLWASAQEHLASAVLRDNPYLSEFREMETALAAAPALDAARVDAYRQALGWARSMPPPGDVNLASEIILEGRFGIPAIVTDSTVSRPILWHSVPGVDSLAGADSARAMRRLLERAREMAQEYEPIEIAYESGDNRLKQYIFYDDSRLIRELTIYPYVQMLFVALFIFVGYVGFSYVRRSEQSSLWVGMAKEAAHQLGTPISSLMGWTELLKGGELSREQRDEALEDIENDIERLRRVAGRFSDIGSLPKLELMEVGPVVAGTADYIRRRMPQQPRHVELAVALEEDLYAPLNGELFEWVVENLLKNALDAIEGLEGEIDVRGYREEGHILIDVRDTGKGIDRRHFKNVFRPGYSTKKRGWGLGLSLAKRIVEDYHGGSLTLEQSRPGHGSTFRITLPAPKA